MTVTHERVMSHPTSCRSVTLNCLGALCGALALAGCNAHDPTTTSIAVTCDPPTVSDYAGHWRLMLPSTLTGSTLSDCTEPAMDGATVIVPTQSVCPADPASPCPVELIFAITIVLKDYHPGGLPLYGIIGQTGSEQFLLGEIRSGACSASFSFGQAGGIQFICSGTFADSHREMFVSCSHGTIPIEGQTQESFCRISPPLEPVVEFLPGTPASS